MKLSRRNVMRTLFWGGGAACFGAAFVEPHFLSITRQNIVMPNLTPDLDGLRIAVFGDIHYKPDSNEELLDELVRTSNTEKPDIDAIVGDYMDHNAAVVPPMLKYLAKLEAKHGVYAVMGNHDGWTSSAGAVQSLFRNAGLEFLVNEHSLISIKGSPFAIAGTDSVWAGYPDPVTMYKGIKKETPTLSLIHEPDFFDDALETHDSVLQLSGHTHGGQCRVPIVGYAPNRVDFGRNYLYGEYAKKNSKLFVTRGVGTTGLPVRFACRPELVMLTLRASA